VDWLFVVAVLGFLVFGPLLAQRVYGQRRGRGYAGRVFRLDIELLPERRDRGRSDALAEALVVDVGDVVNPEAALAVGDVGVFAACLDVEGFVVCGVFVNLLQFVRTLDV
jgi:hypothetical protein